ncbi:MAG: 30S ribosomal protein S4, partial [Candidatus Heimdallarchaeota archaeon AB_125]
MGGIRKYRKKILTPGHPYDKDRIERELPLVGEYGLRNKKELWKARTLLSKARQQARALLALTPEIREQRATELLSRLTRFGMLPQGGDLDSVLALDVKTVLNRRLQTVVHRKGLASSPYQARQFIIHRHIALNKAIVTSPGMLVRIDEEEHVDYAPRSPLVKSDHPSRPQAPPTHVEAPPEKKEKPRGRGKPGAKPGTRPPAKPGTRPPAKPGTRPPAKPGAKPEAKPEARPEAKPGAKPSAKPGAKPSAKPGAKPSAKP